MGDSVYTRNDGGESIHYRKNDTEQGKAGTIPTQLAHALSAGIARKKSPVRVDGGFVVHLTLTAEWRSA